MELIVITTLICVTSLLQAVLYYSNKYNLKQDIAVLRKEHDDIKGKLRQLSDKYNSLTVDR